MKKGIYFILLMCISFIYAIQPEVSKTTFLFCLKKDMAPLQIDKKNDRITVDNIELTNFFDTHLIKDIELLIPNATEMDHDGDIFLNRIYRVYIDDSRRQDLNLIINRISQFSFIHYSEFEYIRKPFYTPNDSNLVANVPAVTSLAFCNQSF